MITVKTDDERRLTQLLRASESIDMPDNGGATTATADAAEETGDQSLTQQTQNHRWNVFGWRLPRDEIEFFAQIVVAYIVIITCIINLSLGNGDSNLWTALLSTCIGGLWPQPRLKQKELVLQ